MFRADSLHSSLDAHRGLLRVLTGARPLGGVVVGQLPYPVSKANLDISIEGGHWEGLRRRRGGEGREGKQNDTPMCTVGEHRPTSANRCTMVLSSTLCITLPLNPLKVASGQR